MIDWLDRNVDQADVLSLDCDLDSFAPHVPDCGSGEDVTAYLVTKSAKYPVVIHSSNAQRAPAMHMELSLAGFDRVYLCPFQSQQQWTADILSALQ